MRPGVRTVRLRIERPATSTVESFGCTTTSSPGSGSDRVPQFVGTDHSPPNINLLTGAAWATDPNDIVLAIAAIATAANDARARVRLSATR